jgi:hypothetical protein
MDDKVIPGTADMSEEKMESMFHRSWADRISNKLFKMLVKKAGPVSQDTTRRYRNAGTCKEWDQWSEKAKKEAPFLYFIHDKFDDISIWFSVKYQRYYTDPKWYLYHRFKQSHHIKPTRLKKGAWHETDIMMLHGVMQLVVDFVEKQKPMEITELLLKREGKENDYDNCTENQKACAETCLEVYEWWKKYPDREKTIEDMYDECSHVKKEGSFLSGIEESMEQNRSVYDKINKASEVLKEEETQMLKKIIVVRRMLWT